MAVSTIDRAVISTSDYYEECAAETGIVARSSVYTCYIKRALDILLSSLGLVVASPVLLLVALLTFIDVGCPVLFKQTRIGRYCQPFTIYKFRNMTNERDENGELLLAEKRVTKFGRLVRRTSLDELPQLWNILKGEMSVIGPRPLLPQYMERYYPRQVMRHAVRPGLECPSYHKLGHMWSWDEQFASDVWYVENCSFPVDVHLFFRVIQMVLDHKDNAARSGANRGSFREDEFGEIR